MGNIKDLFVSYEIAKQLKDKTDFNEACICVYKKGVKGTVYPIMSNEASYPFKTVTNSQTGSTHFAAPLYQQVLDYLRGKNIYIFEHQPNRYQLLNSNGEEIGWNMELTDAIEEAIKLIDGLSNQKADNCPEH